MTTMLSLLPATTLLLWATCISGQTLHVSLDPLLIEPGVTKKLRINCSTEILPEDKDPIGFLDLISLDVERENLESGTNETIATVSIFDSARALQDIDKLKVSGFADSKKVGIELTYTDPDEEQLGDYRCKFHGKDYNNAPKTEMVITSVMKGSPPKPAELLLALLEFTGKFKEFVIGNILAFNEKMKTLIDKVATNEKRLQALEQAIKEKVDA